MEDFENFEILSDKDGNAQIIVNNIFDDLIPHFSKDGKVCLLNPLTGIAFLPDKNTISFNSENEEIEIPFLVLTISISYEKDLVSKSVEIPFTYLNRIDILDNVFGKDLEILNKQVDMLKKQYCYLNDNDFAENRLLFEDKYKVNFISEDNFFKFLYKKFKLLRFTFSYTHFKKFDLYRIDKLIITWNKKDITKEVSLSLFHEYCQMIKSKFEIEASMHSLSAPAPAIDQRGFDLGLTEPQLTILHKHLVDDNFIKCNDTDFINAFSGRQIVNRLEWIDRAERAKFVTVQTLFQLLHSCNIKLSDKNGVIKKDVRTALNSIFINSWGNIHSKLNGFNALTSDRQNAISCMINNLKS